MPTFLPDLLLMVAAVKHVGVHPSLSLILKEQEGRECIGFRCVRLAQLVTRAADHYSKVMLSLYLL